MFPSAGCLLKLLAFCLSVPLGPRTRENPRTCAACARYLDILAASSIPTSRSPTLKFPLSGSGQGSPDYVIPCRRTEQGNDRQPRPLGAKTHLW
ncbi:hypothetical protein F4821DRAFT_231757 [Hypoxylon rubiginosum]|uniref:Uncharacterized protein n=1 Tax=Hypoxylon rubiginosum TaxID=110542 RepID=A0ACC0D9X4_9PEZI|nr:hypothetical protein F4821DRAFT_231757 [Hypoxylon rubiginosum]